MIRYLKLRKQNAGGNRWNRNKRPSSSTQSIFKHQVVGELNDAQTNEKMKHKSENNLISSSSSLTADNWLSHASRCCSESDNCVCMWVASCLAVWTSCWCWVREACAVWCRALMWWSSARACVNSYASSISQTRMRANLSLLDTELIESRRVG